MEVGLIVGLSCFAWWATSQILKETRELSWQTTLLKCEIQDLKTEVQWLKDRTDNVARETEDILAAVREFKRDTYGM